MKILVVEDNPTNMKLTCRLLKSEGYDVVEALDGESGMKKAREILPDLILLDIHLPGTDGLTVAKTLKEDVRTRDIKIIALTAFAMSGDKERILKAGCDGYIPKPIRYKEFLSTVKEFSPEN